MAEGLQRCRRAKVAPTAIVCTPSTIATKELVHRLGLQQATQGCAIKNCWHPSTHSFDVNCFITAAEPLDPAFITDTPTEQSDFRQVTGELSLVKHLGFRA